MATVPDRRVDAALDLHRRGDLRGAMRMYREVLEASPNEPRALHFMGLAMLQSGKPDMAEQFLQLALSAAPDNINALADLAAARYRSGRTAEAIKLFRRVLEAEPSHVDALRNLGSALCAQQRFEEAVPILQRLTDVHPGSSRDLQDLARAQQRSGLIEQAIASYKRALDLAPDDVALRIGLGEACETAGNRKLAWLHYLAALRRDPDSPGALSKLLRLPDGDPGPETVERAARLAEAPRASTAARAMLHAALAYHLDRRGRHDDAFTHLEQGKRLLRGRSPYEIGDYSRSVDRLISVFSREHFERVADHGIASGTPLFIVGMPRSGTTMVEQILSSHPLVAGGGELSMILTLAARVGGLAAGGAAYPDGCRGLDAAATRGLAQAYLDRLAQVSTTHRHVTDKLPFNFIHLGFIATLFPQARVIHCVRDPLDTCLSCYFTEFSSQVRFTDDLDTLGRYYLDYRRLMDHWHRVLPGRILDVRYESVVTEPGREIRRLLDFCGLGWHDACLDFHETARAIQTPSRWQVRQPVHARSVGRWRHYERRLRPLAEMLGP